MLEKRQIAPQAESAAGIHRWLWVYPLLFGLAHSQRVLFTGNQNTKFISGLALANYQHMTEDWMAGITDPFPLFSHLLKWQSQLFTLQIGVHGSFLLILALYALSTLWLAKDLFERNSAFYRTVFIFSVLWLLTHSLATRHFWLSFFPAGLAGQYMLGEYYEPGSFGVLLMTGIAAYLSRQTALAVVCFALAPVFHPAYLIASGLVSSAMVIIPANRTLKIGYSQRLAFWLVVTALLAAYAAWSASLLTAGDPAIRAQAHQILAETRIPHHAIPAEWDVEKTTLFFSTGFIAVWMKRKYFLGQLLLVLLLMVLATILWAVVAFNPTVAVAAPWRVSVFLAPLVWVIWAATVAQGIDRIIQKRALFTAKHSRRIALGAIAIALVVSFTGASNVFRGYQSKPGSDYYALSQFLTDYHTPGNQYLIPPNRKNIRLAAGVPVFATWKSHPTKDDEFLAWHERVKLAESFYSPAGGVSPSDSLASLRRNSITHVVWPVASGEFPLAEPEKIYEDDHFSVWSL